MNRRAHWTRPALRARLASTGVATALLAAACHGPSGHPASLQPTTRSSASTSAALGAESATRPAKPEYPLHTGIVATTFWVGEIFNPHASDGSQMYSTYDSAWYRRYGGCDGVIVARKCKTERRTATNGYFPRHMTPRQNPFYLDLPFDDVNDPSGFSRRCRVIPWAHDPGYAGHCSDRTFSYLKNRWVQIIGPTGRTCYGQIEDAGPGDYHDAAYVFGTSNAAPKNHRYGGAGADVSPALNGCLHFSELNGDTDRISWRFLDAADVPHGPWKRLVTSSGVVD